MAAGFADSPFARFSMHGAALSGDCDEVGSGVDSSTCLAAGRVHHLALFHELPIRFGEADNPGPRTPTKVHIGVKLIPQGFAQRKPFVWIMKWASLGYVKHNSRFTPNELAQHS